MAYEKQTWQCGDTITADKMNHIEDGIANVDVGYSCTEEWVTLTDESVTTEAGNVTNEGDFIYDTPITADTVKVAFNGVEYTCQRMIEGDYGAPYNGSTETFDWSEYPFNFKSSLGGNILVTEVAGTYQVKIEAFKETVTTSECFEKARGYRCAETYSLLMDDSVTTTADGSGNNRGELPISFTLLSDTIKVTFNGVEYICSENEGEWGAPFVSDSYDWSEFPFSILPGRSEALIDTQAPGTYQIKIETAEESVETSECFAKAVNKVVEIPEPTASLSKVTLAFEIYEQYEPFDGPHDGTTGRFINDDVPTLNDIRSKMNTTEYYAAYGSLQMPLTYIDSSKAQFTAFEQKNVQSTSYIRHHIITYNSGGSVRWDRYDIAVPTSY